MWLGAVDKCSLWQLRACCTHPGRCAPALDQMGCGTSSTAPSSTDEPSATEARTPGGPRESTIELEKKIEAAKDDPEQYYELQKERNLRRKAGKLDGQRAETGIAGNF